jgi:hypothetical protein
MISIKNFLTERKQILIKDSVLKLLFRRNLSSNEVNILNSHIRNLLIANNEPDSHLYIYTYHNLDNEFKQHSVLLRIQCTANNAYIQYHEDVPYININDNTTVFYSSKHLYLTTNNIITAIGTLNNNHISWDNTLVLNNDCYMKLPTNTILPDDSQILPTLVLNNLSQDNQNT